jgi:hypothetical protein
VGDLRENAARDTLDATGLYIHPVAQADGAADVQPGRHPHFELRTSADPASTLVWTVEGAVLRQHTAAPPIERADR